MQRKNDAGKTIQFKMTNSTVEFLIFTAQSNENSIEVMVQDENVWLTQKMLGELYNVGINTVNYHITEILKNKEIDEEATIRKFRIVQKEGNRNVTREPIFYSLEIIILIGYRINSERAVQFRQWATSVLKNFTIKGYVLDKERLKNGAYLSEEYYKHLLEEIREIRASERKFYQKITDIYATAMDYNVDSEITKTFFKTVQNKLHFAIHGQTAAEVIVGRADSKKTNMGLTTWKNAPNGKIVKNDVSIAKNYLNEKELKQLDRFVTMYLDYAETQAERNIPITMEDWANKLNAFLQFNEKEILENSGKITAEIAKAFAESEFEKYRIIQDRGFVSDFDRMLDKLIEEDKKEL
ncbi:MAG TPA: cell filamentation protein Fic [Clostridiales bacterium]|nr:MAG: cell filamentation protein Fic [Clostridiales bacterium GWD2_32_59]HAN10756.1 cell filamentation protein Fic [Clostridiales bacterium]